MATINGTSGNNTLNGTNGDDTISGFAGDDIINGGNGDDTISGGDDNDIIDGGNSNDTINGDNGNDTITGGNGNDILDGGAGNDDVSGGNGNDVVRGGTGNDNLTGDNGDDQITGGGNDDTIDGGNGFDTAYYSGNIGEYSFANSGGYLQIIHLGGAGADGHDQVKRVERLVFADRVIDLTGGTNNAPVAVDDNVSINEDTGTYSSGSASVKDNDFDFEGNTLTVTPGNFTGTYGTLHLNSNGTYTYTLFASAQALAQGQNVTDSFNYTVSDGSHSDVGQLVFHIAGLNDAPVANPDTAAGTENQVLTVNVLANDTDVDNGAALTVTSATAPPGKGTASVVGNQVQFNPGTSFDHLAAGATEVVVVNYTIQDEFGATSSSTVTITVTGTNDAPVAHADSASTTENASVNVNVLANDTDVDDGASLTVTSASAPSGQGSASVVGGNLVRFNPGTDFDHLAAGATQVVNVSYTIQDEHGATSSSTIAITVTGTNDGPVANPDTASTTENASVTVSVLANDTDVDDGHVLTVTSATAPAGQGSATVVGGGTQVQWNPGTDFDHLAQGATATVVVNYSIQDEFGATSASTLTITVTGTNDGPVAHPDTASTPGENSPVVVNVLTNDTDVDDGAVLTVTSASAPAGQGTATVVGGGTQVRFDPGHDFDHLADGETTTVVVTYTIQDQFGATSSSTVTITIPGENDPPQANPDTAAGTENQVLTVNVLANDTDVDDSAVLTVTSASAPSGKGTASVVGGTQVQWDPGTDFDHLAAGATEVVVVNYSIQDEHGAASASTVTITVTGTNDGPVAHADSAATDENTSVTVNVLANDTDADDGHVLTVTSATAPAGQGSATVVGGGTQVQWNPGTDFDHLAEGATQVVNVSYTIQDEFGATSTSTIAITVTGTNDGPVAHPDSATTSENASVDINVLANDTDVDDGHSFLVTTASAPAGQGVASVVANQVHFEPGTDFDHLAVGESQVVTLNYTMQDEHGASSSSTVALTVTGTNDAPTINAGGTTASGSVTELPNNDPNENTFVHHADGVIDFTDLDTSDVHSTSVTPGGPGYYGSFTLDPVNEGTDNVDWHYSVSDAAIDGLAAGQTVVQTYDVAINDGHGGIAHQTVTITLHGAADASPPDGTNWYIDNSAVGSTQDGSADNPYLSIAAFNAAQGTPSGPGVNDNVFLLAGTGTGVYAEADGINLLNGQTLTGVPNGSIRPTITATAGDGIDLAQNNNVMHVDIGNTSGVGISDGGTSVGTLNISDVGKSGSGQIVDIDQGGTLNVTLNSASSTGSSGGAIDLNGVGGSFTVTGATTITGAQTGGGIDITASSLNASFGGGGLVSTGTTNAVNFSGNTGSLTLSNNFDIVTTTGAGLNASGGGTITETGAGNSIVSTTGTAVTISGTTIGAAGVTLHDVSSSGAVNGIVLANTGGGAFTITGDGTSVVQGGDASGGTILNSTGAGIVVTSATGVSLTNVAIVNSGTDGIDLNAINGFTFDHGRITDSVGVAGDRGIEIGNFTTGTTVNGTIIVAGSVIGSAVGNAPSDNIAAGVSGGTSTWSISDNNLSNSGNFGFNFELRGGANVTDMTIVGNTFGANNISTLEGVHIAPAAGATGTMVATVGGNNFSNNNIAIDVNGGASTHITYNILDNTIVNTWRTNNATGNSSSHAINLFNPTTSAAGSELDANIQGNTIGSSAIAGSGSSIGNGIRVNYNGNGNGAVLIDQNTIREAPDGRGIEVIGRNGAAGHLDVTITNNDVNHTDLAFDPGVSSAPFSAIFVQANSAGYTVRADIRSNVVPSGTAFDLGSGFLHLQKSGTGILQLVDNPPPSATAASELASHNTGSVSTGGTIPLISGPINLPPPPPMLMMAHGVGHGEANGQTLTQSDLDSAVGSAIQLWAAAGATADQLAAMHNATVSVASLPGLDLGLTSGGHVMIDDNAAGFGWSASGMDLVSVVAHELGHAAGLRDDHGGGDVMDGYLDAGQQKLPGAVFESGAVADAGGVGDLMLAHGDLMPLHFEGFM